MVPSEGVSVFCPNCGRYTAVSPAPLAIAGPGRYGQYVDRPIKDVLPGPEPYYRSPGTGSVWWIGVCNACSAPMLVMDQGLKVYPTPRPAPVADEIPRPMRDDLLEAKECLTVGAFNASVVMARRALQCAAVQQGASAGLPLRKQIHWLDENGKITKSQRKWADAARWIGNEGAHENGPEIVDGQPIVTGVEREDAVDTLDFVERLFEDLYVTTSRADRQIERRGKGGKG